MSFLRFITLLMLLITIAFNFYASVYDLFGNAIGDLSNKYETLANPASYAFSIWSVIYIGLFGFSFWQLTTKRIEKQVLKKIQLFFIINLILNCLWLTCFHSEQLLLSMIVMVALLFTSIAILLLIYTHKTQLPKWVAYTFEVYTGWLSVASIVNLALVLKYKLGFSYTQNTELIILFGVLFVVALLAIFINQRKKEFGCFSLVILWALVAIHINHKQNGLAYTFVPLLPTLMIVPSLLITILKRQKQDTLVE